jgi:hypothetical protein
MNDLLRKASGKRYKSVTKVLSIFKVLNEIFFSIQVISSCELSKWDVKDVASATQEIPSADITPGTFSDLAPMLLTNFYRVAWSAIEFTHSDR